MVMISAREIIFMQVTVIISTIYKNTSTIQSALLEDRDPASVINIITIKFNSYYYY